MGALPCPDNQSLQQLQRCQIAGPEAEQLEEHLVHCTHCAAEVMRLEHEDALVKALRSPSTAEVPQADEVLDRLIIGLKGLWILSGARESAGPSEVPPQDRIKPDCRFLVSAQGPEEPGRLGPYRVLRVLGVGGMGIVYRAVRQDAYRQEVAIKVMRPGLDTHDALRRFRTERQALADLQHPNIARLLDGGALEDGRPYLVMEYIDGQPLDRYCEQHRLDTRERARLVQAVATAVHYAHETGVVHRDLKPANILVTADGTPRVTDFGLAKRQEEGAGQSRTGTVAGTPGYMAPEQAAGQNRQVGAAADVYALGAILYELLTGRPPFRGETPLETLRQVVHEEPVSPRRLHPHLASDLETICLKCLHKEPSRRYASARALAEDLERYRRGEPIQARRVPARERLWRWCRRNPALAAAQAFAAAAILALVGLALAFAFYQRNASQEIARQFHLAERRSALMALESGLNLCDQGRIPQGMLWLAQSLEMAARLPPAAGADLEWLARMNLAHWNPEVMPLRGMFPGGNGIRYVAFGPDGRTILTVSWKATSQRWDAITHKPLGSPFSHPDGFNDVALSADGRWLVTGNRYGIAQVRNASTGEPVGPPLRHSVSVRAVAFSPDGRMVLTVTDEAARFWETISGQPIGSPLRHGKAVSAEASSPDGRTVYSAFSPDGRTVLIGGTNGSANFWDVGTRQIVGNTLSHQGAIQSLAYSPDGRCVVTASEDKTVRLWEAGTGRPLLGSPLVHPQGLEVACFSPDGGTLVTGCKDRNVYFWETATGRPIGAPLVLSRGVATVAYSPDGRMLLTAGWGDSARLWEVAPDRSPVRSFPHPGAVRVAAFSPDGRTAFTGCMDGVGRFWDVATGKERGAIRRPHRRGILTVAYRPDGRFVLTGSFDATAQQWDAATGVPVGPPLPHGSHVNGVTYSPDGATILTGSDDGKARFWDAATGQALGQPLDQGSSVEAVAYRPDGRMVVTGDPSGTAHFWDAATRQVVGSGLRHQANYSDLVFSPDGRKILTSSRDMTARLWDAVTWQPAGPPLPHLGSVVSVAFSPDGRIVLTGSLDATARLWDAATGKPIGPPLRHDDRVSIVAFSPDGRTFLTGGYDQRARLWSVVPPVAGSPEQIRLWVQVVTGMELDDQGAIHVLDAPTWEQRRQRLNDLGGPPVPRSGALVEPRSELNGS